MPTIRVLCLCVFLACGALAHAETLYVSDVLILHLREAPSDRQVANEPSLRSGDAVELLRRDKDSGYWEVRTEDGRQGWVHRRYLVETPIAKARLKTAEERIAALERELAEARRPAASAAEAAADNQALAEENAKLRQTVEALAKGQQALAEHGEWRGLIVGAGLVTAGILLGFIIRPRRKRTVWS